MKKLFMLAMCLTMAVSVPVNADAKSDIITAEEELGIDNSDKKIIERIEILEEELGLDGKGKNVTDRVNQIKDELGISAPAETAPEAPAEEAASETDAGEENLATVAPSDEYVMEKLRLIDSVTEVAAVTEDTDRNRLLNKDGGYIGCVYFRDSQVDARLTGDLIELGTSGGGAVEIFANKRDAQRREAYLASFDGSGLSSGSHKISGTCVIRTSRLLTATQQEELTNRIISVLTDAE